MPRNRVIYQSEALYVGPTPSTGAQPAGGPFADRIKQLHRIQTANYSFNIERTDVNQFGELAAIDRVNLDTPTVTLDFSYLLANLQNERALGFVVDGSYTCVKNLIDKTQDDKNYYIRTSKEGIDAILDTTDTECSTIALGNGYVTSYSTEAAVGGFPTATVNIEALNMTFQNSVSGDNPAVNPEDGTRMADALPALADNGDFRLPIATGSAGTGDLMISVLRPGDITFEFKKTAGEGIASQDNAMTLDSSDYDAPGARLGDGVEQADAKIQSYSISIDLPREPILKLGSRYAFTREITFPVTATMSIDALVADLQTGSLNDLINCDESYDIRVNLLRPTNCSAVADKSKDIFVQYRLKNCKVNSQSFSSDIGSNKSVTFEFATQIGGPNQANQGLWMSGVAHDSLSMERDTSAQQ
jgi:hypothetical protein